MEVVVVTGAAPLGVRAIRAVPDGATIIAADGGVDVALAAGLAPAIVVGDLDSISAQGLAWAEQHATVNRSKPDKDVTDTELALDLGVTLNPDRLLMLGGGDRLDHTLAAVGALGRIEMTSIPIIDAWWDGQYLRVQHAPGTCHLQGLALRTQVSIVATHGDCSGVSTTGLKWQLDDAVLAPLIGLGVSNEVVESTVEITASSGVLTILFSDPPERTSTVDHDTA